MASSRERCTIAVSGTAFELFADLSLVEEGNAYFHVCSIEPLRGGAIAAGTPLYHGAVATQLATAPLAWRFIMQRYFPTVARALPARLASAPGMMPQVLPWRCGFQTLEFAWVQKAVQETLWPVVRLASLSVLRHCEAGWTKTVQAGNPPSLDVSLFPELANWDD